MCGHIPHHRYYYFDGRKDPNHKAELVELRLEGRRYRLVSRLGDLLPPEEIGNRCFPKGVEVESAPYV